MSEQNGNKDQQEIIIVGAGPAGQAAALYAGRSRIPTLVLERGIAGGQLWNTAEVEDYPGFEHIMGPDLAERMQKHAEKFGARFETSEVETISADGDDRVVRTVDGREFRAPAVIVGSPIDRPDRLIAIWRCSASNGMPSRITHRSISPIIPNSSATGRKAPGSMTPSSPRSLSILSSSSSRTTSPDRASTIGWL
jgi:hypothetical protein